MTTIAANCNRSRNNSTPLWPLTNRKRFFFVVGRSWQSRHRFIFVCGFLRCQFSVSRTMKRKITTKNDNIFCLYHKTNLCSFSSHENHYNWMLMRMNKRRMVKSRSEWKKWYREISTQKYRLFFFNQMWRTISVPWNLEFHRNKRLSSKFMFEERKQWKIISNGPEPNENTQNVV